MRSERLRALAITDESSTTKASKKRWSWIRYLLRTALSIVPSANSSVNLWLTTLSHCDPADSRSSSVNLIIISFRLLSESRYSTSRSTVLYYNVLFGVFVLCVAVVAFKIKVSMRTRSFANWECTYSRFLCAHFEVLFFQLHQLNCSTVLMHY